MRSWSPRWTQRSNPHPWPPCAARWNGCGRSSRPPRPPGQAADPGQPSSVARTLAVQLAELKRRHRDEVQALKAALEAAHGENLELRRRLGSRAAASARVGG